MCIVCDAKKLSADPRKTAAEINRELLGMIEQMTAAIDMMANTCALIHHEGRALTKEEAGRIDDTAAHFLDRRVSPEDDPRNGPTPEQIAKALAEVLGVEVTITRINIGPSDETPPDGTTKH